MRFKFKYNNDRIETYKTFDGIIDKKGRNVGAIVIENTMTAIETPDAKTWSVAKNVDAPGTYLRAYIQMTRNDELFGPIQSSHYFTAKTDRDEYINKRLAEMKKRAKKQFC